MTAPGKPKVTEDQIRAWKGSGHPYKLIAAAVAEWAAGKERWTVLPDDGFFGIARQHGVPVRGRLRAGPCPGERTRIGAAAQAAAGPGGQWRVPADPEILRRVRAALAWL